MLHPSDLVISGKERDVVHARAIIAEQLAFTNAYMTWTRDANQIEDRLRTLWRESRAASGSSIDEQLAELRTVERDLKAAKIEYEEWEVLRRKKLLVERGLLQVVAGLTDAPKEPADKETVPAGSGAMSQDTTRSQPEPVPALVALVTVVLLEWLRTRMGWFRDRLSPPFPIRRRSPSE